MDLCDRLFVEEARFVIAVAAVVLDCRRGFGRKTKIYRVVDSIIGRVGCHDQ